MHRPQAGLRDLPAADPVRGIPRDSERHRQFASGARKKQEGPFAGSNRYYRGRIVDGLRAAEGAHVSLSALGPLVREDYAAEHADWLLKLVRDLERDGLAKVAEPNATYAIGNDDDPQVSLP